MSGVYDKSLKRLVDDNREDFARWAMQFLEGKELIVIGTRPTEFNPTMTADAILDVVIDGERVLLHFEFQAKNEQDVPVRTAAYYLQTWQRYNLPVFSFVIYLKKDGTLPEVPMRLQFRGRQTISFDYETIDLSRMSAEDIRQTGLPGVQALMILTRDGATREVAEEVLTSLEVAEKKDSLSAAYMLITHIFEAKNQDDLDWLKKRWDIMSDELRNTWLYQQILKEGQEEERKRIEAEREQERKRMEAERERMEAERRQELERWRQTLVGVIHAQFADQRLELQARGKATLINDLDVLQGLILKIVSTHTPEEAENYLLHWPQAS